jgi:leucyl-tRNA synthetase
MDEYDFKTIETKWQKYWADKKYGQSEDFSDKTKFYNLVEFPYPSGAGLHVGHCMSYGATDAHSRMKRMQCFNVMFPMGWDAFGLPTENFAIKNKIKPADATTQNVAVFKQQMKSLGYSFDWTREINTTDPNYYKWTQWIFLQFYKHGIVDGKLVEISDDNKSTPRLAYQAEMSVNWCPSCKIVLANEEVVNGKCERCNTEATKRRQKQWMLRITSYAERLINDLEYVDYLDQIKTQQINWIGKSIGSNLKFKIKDSDQIIEVFTTRADTLFGCTYVVIAPESDLISKLKSQISNLDEVEKYINNAKNKSDIERTDLDKDKTGVELKGIKAINPINNEEVPVWVADYVLAGYGTGAVMAVPSHDQRDFEFAEKYNLKIKQIIAPEVTYFKTPVRQDKTWVERNGVEALVYNRKTDKYLGLKWKNQPWVGFVTGGIDKDENPEEAAKREVFEETGYKNIKLIKKLGTTSPKFFAAHKDENRKGIYHGFLFELENEEKHNIDESETAKHEVIWLDRKDITVENIVCASLNLWLKTIDHDSAFIEYGTLFDSGEFDGLSSNEAKLKITEKLKEKDLGDFSVNYKLRDWIFSRQHYWGEPIPIIHCDKCGIVPVPENQLPVTLPDVENYEPTETGESPLSKIDSWVNTTCPICGGKARRETDTMPNWAGSSWYFLRYTDPENDQFFKKLDFAQPEVTLTETDKIYIEEFKAIYSELEEKGIKTWAANRFLLNGINRKVWLNFRTISVMGWKDDLEKVEKYITGRGYKTETVYPYGKLFTKDGLRFEFVSMKKVGKDIISYSEKGALQKMTFNDLPSFPLGELNGFYYRTVSPKYNLNHYKFIQQNESETRKGLGDVQKIEFLEKWLEANNGNRLYWMPVDLYNGGPEHITLHLLYSRFWHKFLYDLQVVPTIEPYQKRILHGIILGPDGQKMSKSKGNVINPDEMVEKFGADTLRAYIMFIGPYDQESAWNMAGIQGVHRFLKKIWVNASKVSSTKDTSDTLVKLNQSIISIGSDLENFHMNTVISKLMELNNTFEKAEKISIDSFKTFLKLLYPACPHLSSELWKKFSENVSIEESAWPEPDQDYLVASEIEIAVSINGKTRQIIKIKPDLTENEVLEIAKNDPKIKELLKRLEIKKSIYISGRIVNFVI